MSNSYEIYLKNSSTSLGIKFDGTPADLCNKFLSAGDSFLVFDSNYENHPVYIRGEQIAGFCLYPSYKDGDVLPHKS